MPSTLACSPMPYCCAAWQLLRNAANVGDLNCRCRSPDCG
ncbi:hypothetical protein BVRB_8g189620 [Beta vulgaris subsp. vulgaris]|nr:hypothetical protein BVRB_8g189620 [Beta vulgaris subsp. vulgaris]